VDKFLPGKAYYHKFFYFIKPILVQTIIAQIKKTPATPLISVQEISTTQPHWKNDSDPNYP